MADPLLRRAYVRDRVLIDANRTIDSVFPTIGVILTGEELEILRNLLEYANRIESFVDEYDDNTYVVPDDETWETLQTIMASLEAKLMGGKNTIFGVSDRLVLRQSEFMSGTGGHSQDHDTVPEGEIWVIEGISFLTDTATGLVTPHLDDGNGDLALGESITLAAWIYTTMRNIQAYLVEDDFLRIEWSNMVDGQKMVSQAWGYILTVDK